MTDRATRLSDCPLVPESPMSPEAEQALQSLDVKLQGPPRFSRPLKDQTTATGSTARLSCHLTGTSGTHRGCQIVSRSSGLRDD